MLCNTVCGHYRSPNAVEFSSNSTIHMMHGLQAYTFSHTVLHSFRPAPLMLCICLVIASKASVLLRCNASLSVYIYNYI